VYANIINDWVFFWFCLVYVPIQIVITIVYWVKWTEAQTAVGGQVGLGAFWAHIFEEDEEE